MSGIEVKGGRDGLILVLPETGTNSQLLASLYHYLSSKGDFFKGADLSVEIGRRVMTEEDVAQLQELLTQWDVTLSALHSLDNQTRESAQQLHLSVPDLDELGAFGAPVPRPISAPSESQEALSVHRTLRSGQLIRYPGSVMVIGDVNPGAEIVAGGDVIVWGNLRGVVHAGAMGDSNAVVCALRLDPTQLRISSQIAMSPEAPKAKRGRIWQRIGPRSPESALLQDGKIVVEKWSGK